MQDLVIAGDQFQSRLFLGTGKYSSNSVMKASLEASGTQMATVALKRFDPTAPKDDSMLQHFDIPGITILPNTSGVRTAKEAVFAAELAREALETNFIKLEIHPDPRYLLPDHIESLKATEELAKKGFHVLPYINADPVICKYLESAGAAALMPLGAPIGSNEGLKTKAMLEIIIEQSQLPVVVDAGIGAPSHAAEAMEMGADAVLVNTAIAIANDPVEMSIAFKLAVEAGRRAFLAKLAPTSHKAIASSPLTSFLD